MLTEVDEKRVTAVRSGRRALPGVLLGALALVATVCTGFPAAAAAPAAPAGPVPDFGGSRFVIVKMVDHRLLQPDFLPPGRYTFRALNNGRAPHALQIAGPGVHARTPVVEPGGSADVTVTLPPGIYDFWCPVGNHRQMGMQLDVRVG